MLSTVKTILSIIVLSFLLSFPHSCSKKDNTPIPKNGILDLREYSNFEILKLNGEWAFYWEEFIDPANPDSTLSNQIISVPSYWNQYKDLIPSVKGFGYGSYKLKILFPEGYANKLCLNVPVFDAAFELYINGKLVGNNGKPGTNMESTIPEYRPFMYDFIPDSSEIDIVIHVANFNHRRGGFWKTMYLGQEKNIHPITEKAKILSHALLGILLGTVILFFILFLLDKHRKSFLFFSLASAGVLLRLLYTGFYSGPTLIPIPWDWIVRLEYLGTYMICIFAMLYFDSLFPRKNMKAIIKNICLFFAVLVIFPLFFKIHIYAWSIYFIEVSGILILLNYTIYSFRRMLKKQKIEAVFFISIFILLIALVNDILIANSQTFLNTEYVLPLAFFFLVLSNSFLLVNDWISSFREKEAMHTELLQINKNLEGIVQKRTEDLNKTNNELKTSLDFKTRMFAIIAHDLKSPVSTLAQYADLIYKKNKSTDENLLFANLRQLSFSAVDLINNLLTWGNMQGVEMQYKPVMCDIKAECEDIQKILSQQFEQKHVKLIIDIPETLNAYCDPYLLKITIRNIISNALKFTEANGRVSISGFEDNDISTIKIEDNGIGMKAEKIEEILNNNTKSTRGTDGEKGTGLGFIVIKDLIKLNKGTLCIESNPGRGTTISFTLPGKP